MNAQIISVSKRPATLADVPAAVSIVTAEDIQRSGVTTIPDALRLVPGVNVAQADSNSWAVSIRGFNSVLANKLLVMIDGRTIYNPVFGGTFWEAHDLVMEDIERIEVVRGPGGTLWGANAVNGVINIITKRAQDTQGNLVSTLYGNEEKGTLSMRHGGSFAEDGYYRLYAKGFNRDSFKDPDGGDAYDEWDGYRTGFRVDRGENFTLQGDVYRLQENQFRNESFLVAPVSILRRQHLKYEGANLLGRWQGKRDDGSSVSVQTYLDWTRRNEPYNFVDNRTIFDIEAQYNWPIMGRHEIIGGAGYRFAADNEEITRNTSFDPLGRRDSLYSAFIQDKIELAPDRWYLTLGSKFEHNEYSGFEIQPSARLQYQPDDHQTWWAAVSRAVRTPTPIEEDLTSTLATAVNVRAAFVPNDDFKSEVLNAYELGYRNQITPTLSADVATFFNVYDHLET
ncbi:MAG TPA: TonB-dependent receptor, partial [Alphaproteobacteria bacterium]